MRALLLVLASLAAFPLHGQDSARTRVVTLVVRDSASRLPVSRAFVSFGADRHWQAQSDTLGSVMLRIPWSVADSLRVRAPGFQPYARFIGRTNEDVLSLDATLTPTVQALAELSTVERGTVSNNRLADFERRRSSGANGIFIARDEIAKRNSVRTTDLFRGHAGLRVVDSASLKLVVSNRSFTPSLVSRSAPGGYCVIPIVVDGLLREGSFQVDLIAPNEIHGIEIYTGQGSVPPAFSSMQKNAWCGLIVIWTRDR